jgi:O-acetyl-ADP-ribose deacetylase (regulator of RNase III)
MIIPLSTQSIFDSNALALVCPVNTVGVMGAGLALSVRKRYPRTAELYEVWCQHWKDDAFHTLLLARDKTEPRTILFFPTKHHWRSPSDLALIERGLTAFATAAQNGEFRERGVVSFAFPQLGCGLGALDWETQVKPLMLRYLEPLPAPISIKIHLYQPRAPRV